MMSIDRAIYQYVRSSCRIEPKLWAQTELQDLESWSWKNNTVKTKLVHFYRLFHFCQCFNSLLNSDFAALKPNQWVWCKQYFTLSSRSGVSSQSETRQVFTIKHEFWSTLSQTRCLTWNICSVPLVQKLIVEVSRLVLVPDPTSVAVQDFLHPPPTKFWDRSQHDPEASLSHTQLPMFWWCEPWDRSAQ